MTASSATSPGARLRAAWSQPGLEVLVGVHDALSARIAAEAGAAALWASGLGLSAVRGLRDASEITATELLDALEQITDAVTVPVLADGDTGFGDFNNARRLARKLMTRGVAGVVVEDKAFPKRNSFVRGQSPLADEGEFCGKLRAMLDARGGRDFAVVARTEALVLGRSIDEALARAEAYVAAGADAIVVHSKARTADEVLAFARRWERRAPLLVIPTTYPHFDRDALERAGVAAVVCANQSLRAAVRAMREASSRLVVERSSAGVEAAIAPLRELFELTDMDELLAAEARYARRGS